MGGHPKDPKCKGNVVISSTSWLSTNENKLNNLIYFDNENKLLNKINYLIKFPLFLPYSKDSRKGRNRVFLKRSIEFFENSEIFHGSS
jgi:hypothetical protein